LSFFSVSVKTEKMSSEVKLGNLGDDVLKAPFLITQDDF
jgi:hypothetical protein